MNPSLTIRIRGDEPNKLTAEVLEPTGAWAKMHALKPVDLEGDREGGGRRLGESLFVEPLDFLLRRAMKSSYFTFLRVLIESKSIQVHSMPWELLTAPARIPITTRQIAVSHIVQRREGRSYTPPVRKKKISALAAISKSDDSLFSSITDGFTNAYQDNPLFVEYVDWSHDQIDKADKVLAWGAEIVTVVAHANDATIIVPDNNSPGIDDVSWQIDADFIQRLGVASRVMITLICQTKDAGMPAARRLLERRVPCIIGYDGTFEAVLSTFVSAGITALLLTGRPLDHALSLFRQLLNNSSKPNTLYKPSRLVMYCDHENALEPLTNRLIAVPEFANQHVEELLDELEQTVQSSAELRESENATDKLDPSWTRKMNDLALVKRLFGA